MPFRTKKRENGTRSILKYNAKERERKIEKVTEEANSTELEERGAADQSLNNNLGPKCSNQAEIDPDEKFKNLDEYTKSANSIFSCFATSYGLLTLVLAVQTHSGKCRKGLNLYQPVMNGIVGFSTNIVINCDCGWSKKCNMVGDRNQQTIFDNSIYTAMTILGMIPSKIKAFLKLLNFGGQNWRGTTVGVKPESNKNIQNRTKIQENIIREKDIIEDQELDKVKNNYDPENLPVFKADGYYDVKNAQFCLCTAYVESTDGTDDKCVGTIVVKRAGFRSAEEISKGYGVIVDTNSHCLEGIGMEYLMKRIASKILKFALVLDGDLKVRPIQYVSYSKNDHMVKMTTG